VARRAFAWENVPLPRAPGMFFFRDAPAAFAPASAGPEEAPVARAGEGLPALCLKGLEAEEGFAGRPRDAVALAWAFANDEDGGHWRPDASRVRVSWEADNGDAGESVGHDMPGRRWPAWLAALVPRENVSYSMEKKRRNEKWVFPWPSASAGAAAGAWRRLTVTLDPLFRVDAWEEIPLVPAGAETLSPATEIHSGPLTWTAIKPSQPGEHTEVRLALDAAALPDGDPAWGALAELAAAEDWIVHVSELIYEGTGPDGKPAWRLSLLPGFFPDRLGEGELRLRFPARGLRTAAAYTFHDIPLPSRPGLLDFAEEHRRRRFAAQVRADGYTPEHPLRLEANGDLFIAAREGTAGIEYIQTTLSFPRETLPAEWFEGPSPLRPAAQGAFTRLETDRGAVDPEDGEYRWRMDVFQLKPSWREAFRAADGRKPAADCPPTDWEMTLLIPVPAAAREIRELRGYFELYRVLEEAAFTIALPPDPRMPARERGGVTLRSVVLEDHRIPGAGEIICKGTMPLSLPPDPRHVLEDGNLFHVMPTLIRQVDPPPPSPSSNHYPGSGFGFGRITPGEGEALRIDFERHFWWSGSAPESFSFAVATRAEAVRVPFALQPFVLPADKRLPWDAPFGPRGELSAVVQGHPVRLLALSSHRHRSAEGRDSQYYTVPLAFEDMKGDHHSSSSDSYNRAFTVRAVTETGETLDMAPKTAGGIQRDQKGLVFTIPLNAPASPADRLVELTIVFDPPTLGYMHVPLPEVVDLQAFTTTFRDVGLPRLPAPPAEPDFF
jgi:hypothetical protein